MEFYKDAVIIMEREVDLPSLESTCIPNVFKDRTWAPVLCSLVDVHLVLVWEFFSNVVVEGDHLNCWGEREGLHTISFIYSELPSDQAGDSKVFSSI